MLVAPDLFLPCQNLKMERLSRPEFSMTCSGYWTNTSSHSLPLDLTENFNTHFVYLDICLFVDAFIHLFIYWCIYLFIYLVHQNFFEDHATVIPQADKVRKKSLLQRIFISNIKHCCPGHNYVLICFFYFKKFLRVIIN